MWIIFKKKMHMCILAKNMLKLLFGIISRSLKQTKSSDQTKKYGNK